MQCARDIDRTFLTFSHIRETPYMNIICDNAGAAVFTELLPEVGDWSTAVRTVEAVSLSKVAFNKGAVLNVDQVGLVFRLK